MNYKLEHTRQIVSLFIIIPVVVLIVIVVFIAIRQNMFEKRFYYSTALENAIGVSSQTPVLYKGFEIGRVHHYELDEDGSIGVEFYVLKRYQHLMVEESVIYRTTIPITNMTTLEYVRAPESSQLLAEGEYIVSSDFPEGRRLLRRYAPKSSDPIGTIVENLEMLTTELNQDNNADKGALMRILVSAADLSQKADVTLDLLNDNLREMRTLTTNLNRDQNPESGVILRIMNNLADISESIAGQTDDIERLLATANTAAENYANPDSLIIRMLDPDGNTLISPLSTSLYALSGTLQETEKILGSLARANPELLQIINNLNDTLSKASKTLEALNNNPLLRGGITPSRIKAFAPEGRMDEVPGEE
jgi:phospholipid/cholesterol/gamma-HCH transport system substrate-binding protein